MSLISEVQPGSSRKKIIPAFDGIIFDIDNVLIDTRLSYLNAIRWTIELFLTHGNVPFFEQKKKTSGPQILSHKDVENFKLLGGFNDDWDCCYGILVYLLTLPVKGRTVPDLKKAMDIPGFVSKITKKPLRVSGIVDLLGHPRQVTIEKISRIFQEVYLGKNVFEKVERRPATHWSKRGLIHKERLIFKLPTLRKLKKQGFHLGIATGRPRFEALFALRRFGVAEFFDAITTMDEVRAAEKERKESLRKPHPFSLIETANKIGKGKRFVYIGDLPDDVLAATRAQAEIQIRSAAYLGCAADPARAQEEMKKVKPDFILKKPVSLHNILWSGQS